MSPSVSKVLSGAELDGLELILDGLIGSLDGYSLPRQSVEDDSCRATLQVAAAIAEQLHERTELILEDPDRTPIASVSVTQLERTVDGGAWVAGPVTALRRAEHGPARTRRLSTSVRLAGQTAIFSGSVRAADVLRMLSRADGKPVNLIGIGPADQAQTIRLIKDLEDCAKAIPHASVWYLPDAEIGAQETVDLALEVLRARGAEDPLDFRQEEKPAASGAVVLFTGLSGAGKSTIARAFVERVRACSNSRAVLLDGDNVRREIAGELGYGREDRDRNLQRIAWVAARVAEAGALAVCAPIAPFAASRQSMREKVEPASPFIIVYVATPLDVAEKRDRKGLYRKARAGQIKDFTGIDSPYEEPLDADLTIDTSVLGVQECVDEVVRMLIEREVLSVAT